MTMVYRKPRESSRKNVYKKEVVTDRFSHVSDHNKGVLESFPGIYVENIDDFVEI